MLSEQQRLWIALKGAEHYAHEAAEDMLSALNAGKRPRYAAMSKVADRHFAVIMEVFDVEQNIRIIKTCETFSSFWRSPSPRMTRAPSLNNPRKVLAASARAA